MRPGQRLDGSHTRAHTQDCPVCAARESGHSPIDPLPGQPGRLYLTSDREYARMYAAQAHGGDLYRVQPVGELVESREDRFPTWTVEAAIIKVVYARAVRLTAGQRSALLRRWTEADAQADGWAGELAAMSAADRRRLHRDELDELWSAAHAIGREARRRKDAGLR